MKKNSYLHEVPYLQDGNGLQVIRQKNTTVPSILNPEFRKKGGVIKYQKPAGPFTIKLPSMAEQSRIMSDYRKAEEPYWSGVYPTKEQIATFVAARDELDKYKMPGEPTYGGHKTYWDFHLFDRDAIDKYDEAQRTPISRQIKYFPNKEKTGYQGFYNTMNKDSTIVQKPFGSPVNTRPKDGKLIKLERKGGYLFNNINK